MTDYYNTELKIGDFICWAPYRGLIMFGKVINVSSTTLKVQEYWNGKLIENSNKIVKTIHFYIIPKLPIKTTNDKR